MKSANKGFTLIELIIVIVILGILAVTASPKFLDIQGDARASTVEGLKGSLSGAIKVLNAKAIVQNKTAADSATTSPAVNVKYGYPDAKVADLQAILDISSAAAANGNTSNVEWEIKEVAVSGGPDQAKLFPAGNYDGNTATSPTISEASCYVLYTEAESATVPAKVEAVTTGCK
jgi:MSHA pilin protein MshA